MYSWQYNEKIIKDIIYNRARDYGRFVAEVMLDSPKICAEFMKGFNDELERRTGGYDTPPSDSDGVS